MRILWLYLENFKCYSKVRIPEEGILPTGFIRIDGLNSSGKSTLFDAIYYALFYEPSKEKYLVGKKEDLIRRGTGETLVQLAFEVDEKCFLVERKHGKKFAVQANLVELDYSEALKGDSKVIKRVSSGAEDVNKKISELLNITSTKAVKTLIVRQGEIQQLAEARGAELRDLIYNLFDLDYYTERSKIIIQRRIEQLEEEKQNYAIKINTEEAQKMIEEYREKIKEIEKLIEQNKKSVESLSRELQKYPKIDELNKIKEAISLVSAKKDEIARNKKNLELQAKRLDVSLPVTEQSIQDALNAVKKAQEELNRMLDEHQNQLQETVATISQIDNELVKLRKRKESLESVLKEKGEKAICEVCEQEIEGEYLTNLIERTKKKIPELEQQKKQLLRTKKELMNSIASVERSKREQNSKEVAINTLFQLLKQSAELKKELKAKESRVITLLKPFSVDKPEFLAKKYGLLRFEDLYEKIQSLQKSKTEKEVIIKQQHIRKNDSIKEIKKLEQIIVENEKKEEMLEEIAQKIDMLEQIKEYVKGFIADDLITYRLLPAIQHSTMNFIELFTLGRYSEIYLEPTTQKTLVLNVRDTEMDYVKSQQLLSGGDRAAIGLAMRVGISSLLKRMRPMKNSPYRPPKMDILILDEPLGSLDLKRREKVLEGLLAEKRFSQIFLISHASTNRQIKAPTLHVNFAVTGSTITFIPPPTEIEEEAEG